MLFIAYRGPSMNPTLEESDLLEVEPYACRVPSVGDVVYCTHPGTSAPIVHRIVRQTLLGYELRGDNNDCCDEDIFPLQTLIGRVIAAWTGNRRRLIPGGRRGRLTHDLCLLKRKWIHSRQGLSRLWLCLGWVYRTVACSSPLPGWIPDPWRPRVVAFHSEKGCRYRLLLRNLVIGVFDQQRRVWHIRRPFRLIVDERVLPPGGSIANIASSVLESGK